MTSDAPSRRDYDLVVLGGGSGGYAAARTARSLGASVAIVDSGPLGGLCILRGCMPSKALIASADAAQRVREAPQLGISVAPPQPDPTAIIARKRRLIDGFAGYRVEQLESYPLFAGTARFLSATEILVGESIKLTARNVVIATGSIVAPPFLPGLAEVGALDSDDILDLADVPDSIIVLGGGYVATELGQYLHRIGVKTTLVLRAKHVLSDEDVDIGMCLTESLAAEGMRVETGARIVQAKRDDAGRKGVTFVRDGVETTVWADEILSCLGRMPNIAGLDLDAVGVRAHPMRGIEVDETLRTTNPSVYAVGDVNGVCALVHVAIYQGEIAARNAITNSHHAADYRLQTAHAVFTEPQVGVVGHTERSLDAAGIPYLSASYPFEDHGKALVIGRPAGLVKIIAHPDTGKILGAAVVGAEGSELIHEMIVAMQFDATVEQFMKIPHLHPTLAEIWTYPAEELVDMIEMRKSTFSVAK